MKRKLSYLAEFLRLIRGNFHNRITFYVVTGGLALSSTPWWLPILYKALDIGLGTPETVEQLSSSVSGIGILLIPLALAYRLIVAFWIERGSTSARDQTMSLPLQLLTSVKGTNYSIPDHGDNRNQTAASPGYSYTVIAVRIVLGPTSGMTLHDHRLALFDDRERGGWIEAEQFDDGYRTWANADDSLNKSLLSYQKAKLGGLPNNPKDFAIPKEGSARIVLSGYLTTKESLEREYRYAVLVVLHINTSYVALLCNLAENESAKMLGHKVFRDSGEFPVNAARKWAAKVVQRQRKQGSLETPTPSRVVIEDLE